LLLTYNIFLKLKIHEMGLSKRLSKILASWIAKLVIALLSILIFLTVIDPHSGNDVSITFLSKLVFTTDLLLHIFGVNDNYALGSSFDKKQTSRKDNVISVEFDKSDYFRLTPLREVHPNDPNWKKVFQKEFNENSRPIVVRNLQFHAKDIFMNTTDWDLPFLNKLYRDKSIPVFTSKTNDKSVILETFDKYVRELRNRNQFRYARCIDDVDHTLLNGFSAEKLVGLMGKQLAKQITLFLNGDYGYCLFLSSNHVNTRLHSDMGTSAFLMIHGRKRWYLFPPTQSRYLMPVGHDFNVAFNSKVDIFAKNISKTHPESLVAEGWEVTLEAGDVLFFPAFTWHAVENLDEVNIGLDFALYDIPHALYSNPILALGSAMNPRIWYRVLGSLLTGKVNSLKAIFWEGYLQTPNSLNAV
jgi:hypothetical protein